ncbi:hypothetical protein DM01DRAFT_1171340 [Hesseltinella vesiculosa]|uniref:Uncharacterized protein n=1 Tax=Hesseltinella vesiculosa TaxID=101127 RepID=A0A1X2G5B4_9FUNG|nr:hypothetical protein DM01DRAFT_1171340 [Hesseltinella vesiculosa]
MLAFVTCRFPFIAVTGPSGLRRNAQSKHDVLLLSVFLAVKASCILASGIKKKDLGLIPQTLQVAKKSLYYTR